MFDEWLANKRMGSSRKGGAPVRDRTIAILKENFNLDLRARIGEVKVRRLTRAALQYCLDGPRKRNAPASAAQVYRTLRGLVNFAIKGDYVEGLDPMRGIEKPRPYRPGPVNAAKDAELVALFSTLESSAMSAATRMAIELQLLSGVRAGEARLASLGRVRPGGGNVDHPFRARQDRTDVYHPVVAPCPRLVERARALRGLNSTGVGSCPAPPEATSRRSRSHAPLRGLPHARWQRRQEAPTARPSTHVQDNAVAARYCAACRRTLHEPPGDGDHAPRLRRLTTTAMR